MSIWGLLLILTYPLLLLLLNVLNYLANNKSGQSIELYRNDIIVYLYAFFYFVVPVSFFILLPTGIVLLIVGLVKRRK